MNRFEHIDPKLSQLAYKLNARLRIDRRYYPDKPPVLQERRIDWTDGVIQKAILIQPLFEISGVNENWWSVKAVAWYDQTHPKEWKRFRWHKHFAENQPFEVIEQTIDALLTFAENELTAITMDDLY